MPREDSGRLGRQAVVRLETEQGECVACGAVQRAEPPVVVVLSPQPVLAPARTECRGRLVSRLQPPRLGRRLVHRQRHEQRAGCAPADVVGGVVDVAADEGVKIVRERGVGCEPEGDEQRARLAVEECSRAMVLIRRRIGLGALELQGTHRNAGELERCLGMTTAPERVERPDQPGRAGVKDLQRVSHGRDVRLPLVGGPEQIRVERRVGIGDDRSDRILDTPRIPRLVGQRLELLWLVERSRHHRFLLVDPL